MEDENKLFCINEKGNEKNSANKKIFLIKKNNSKPVNIFERKITNNTVLNTNITSSKNILPITERNSYSTVKKNNSITFNNKQKKFNNNSYSKNSDLNKKIPNQNRMNSSSNMPYVISNTIPNTYINTSTIL